jgi:hypothetical protein
VMTVVGMTDAAASYSIIFTAANDEVGTVCTYQSLGAVREAYDVCRTWHGQH